MPALLERWRARRANESQTGDAGGGDLSPLHNGGTT
jgi:hypothetical protein